MEPYLTGKTLVTQQEWTLFIDGLQQATTQNTSLDLEPLKKRLVEAVLKRAQQCTGPIGVFFSGGVDSTLIAWILKQHDIPFTCYTVGFQDDGTKEPEDVTESKRCAAELGFEQEIIVLNLEEIEAVITQTKKLLGATGHPEGGSPRPATARSDVPTTVAGDAPSLLNPINVGVGAVVVAAAEKGKGVTEFFGGLGSEEIFAGYQRHEHATNVQEECWTGLKGMYERDLLRDYALGKGLGVVVHTPFLDEHVIEAAMEISGEEKIKEVDGVEVKKHCLRVIAEELDLPKQWAWRPKRAAQYGSRTDSALDKLAKRKGVTKKEYSETVF